MNTKSCQILGLGVSLLILPLMAVFAQSFLLDGEKLLLANKPAEALVFLEASIGQGQVSEKLYLYLGLAYAATNQPEKAAQMFRRGLEFKGELASSLYYNLGNVEMSSGKYPEAEGEYSSALSLTPRDGDVFLNRANVRLVRENYQGALDDYLQVLAIQPQNPQRLEIIRLTELLRGHLVAQADAVRRAEAEKLAEIARAEEARREAERIAAIEDAQRREAEQARNAEEERLRIAEAARIAEENRRREELLAKIRESLARASEETQNLHAGEGNVESTQEELDLAP